VLLCIVDELQLFRAVVPHNDAWMSARTADEKAKIKALRQEASSLKALFTSWPFLVKLGTLAVGWVIFFGKLYILAYCAIILCLHFRDATALMNNVSDKSAQQDEHALEARISVVQQYVSMLQASGTLEAPLLLS
jgi:hypothetical protein